MNDSISDTPQHTVKLVEHTKLSNMVIAARTCWDSFEHGGVYTEPTDCISDKDIALLDRIVNKHKHGSISEHAVYTFDIKGISRACLQELSRHRMASPSVRSSRYTLKELKSELPFTYIKGRESLYKRAAKYIVFTPNTLVNISSIEALERLRVLIYNGISNDMAKFAMPECYKVNEILTINARGLKNFLQLRLSKDALWEIRELANSIRDAIPKEHMFLYQDLD